MGAHDETDRPALAETLTQPDRMGESLATRLALSSTYMMLSGFALENAIKGILVADDPSWIVGGARIVEWPGSGHDLLGLFNRAGVALDEPQERLLERLTAFGEWAARYPVPLKSAELRRSLKNSEWGGNLTQWDATDVELIDVLFDRLRNELWARARAWDQGREDQLESERRAERPELEARLKAETHVVERPDGAIEFHVRHEDEQPGIALTCAACNAAFVFNPRVIAGICRCGSLFLREFEFSPSSGGTTPTMVRYPPAN